MQRKTESSTVHSVDKAMNLIELLLFKRQALSLNEISQLAGYPKSTAHALLSTLREHDMIEQQPDGKYFLGIRLFECGCVVSSAWDISVASREHLEHLAYSSRETAIISTMIKNDVIIIEHCIGNSGLKIVSDVGSKLPLHATSQGKLLLSQFTDSEVVKILNDAKMPAYTAHTIIDVNEFLAELTRIRTNKYATEDGEHKVGLRSISAPVYDRSGKMKYALGVIGLLNRVQSEEFQAKIESVCASAEKLSKVLGYSGA